MARERMERAIRALLGSTEKEEKKEVTSKIRYPSLITPTMDVFRACAALYEQAKMEPFPLDIEESMKDLQGIEKLYQALIGSYGFIIEPYISGVFYVSAYGESFYHSGDEFRKKLYAQDIEVFIALLRNHAAYLQGMVDQQKVGGGQDPLKTWHMKPHLLHETADEIEKLLNTYTQVRRYLYEHEVHSDRPIVTK